MDSPKKTNSVLQTFETPVWTLIATQLPGEQIGRLKLTGCKELWQRLCSEGVVKAVILGKDHLTFKKWPSFLNELPSVEEFSILNTNDEWWNAWQPRLNMVAKSLRKLTINATKDKSASFFRREDGTTLWLTEHVPQLEALDVALDWNADARWTARIPQITVLRCLECICSVPLPSTLTHLACSQIAPGKDFVASNFPPNLTSIDARDILNPERIIPNLPTSITSINIERHDNKLDRDRYDHLINLKTVGEICLDKGVYLDPRLQATPELVLVLPPTVTRLLLTRLPSECWAHLPQTLESLEIHSISIRNAVEKITAESPRRGLANQYPIQLLPKSITQLKLDFDNFSYLDFDALLYPIGASPYEETLFPTNLTCLDLLNGQLSKNAVQHLPPSLKEFTISHLDGAICELIPRELEKLRGDRVIMSPELIKNLPRSLTSLDFIFGAWLDPTDGSKKDMLDYWSDDSPWSKILWMGDYVLPPTLTHLVLQNLVDPGDAFASQDLQLLEILDMRDTRTLQNSSIKLLSPRLTRLNLARASEITGKCFGDLPRNLTWLNLRSSSKVSRSGIKRLPPNLKVLYLENAIKLKNSCIADLPRNLETLRLDKNTIITPDVFWDLPYKLRNPLESNGFVTATWDTQKLDKAQVGEPPMPTSNSCQIQ